MQRRIAIWILGTFWTSPSLDIKVIVDFIPIYLHLWKLSGRAQLRAHLLSHNYILRPLLELRSLLSTDPHCFSLNTLTPCQWLKIKDSIIDIGNRFNKVFLTFDPHNKEFSSGSKIIDIYPSHFFFHSFNKYSNKNLKSHSCQLDNLAIIFSLDPSYTLVVTDISIKSYIATSIAHIHVHDKPVTKTIYHTMNVMSTKAKLFAIRCGINQATNIQGISKIAVIIDLLYSAQRIFNSLLHPFQLHTKAILNKLRSFFLKNLNNSIEFWECPSHCK